MMQFSDLTVFVRQIANGSMAIGALFLIAIFGRYIWTYWSERNENIAVKAAIAITILSLGHFIRAASGWTEFYWVERGWNIDLWLFKSWSWFIVAASFIMFGKVLMILSFAPWHYRKQLAAAAVATSIGVPLALSFLR